MAISLFRAFLDGRATQDREKEALPRKKLSSAITLARVLNFSSSANVRLRVITARYGGMQRRSIRFSYAHSFSANAKRSWLLLVAVEALKLEGTSSLKGTTFALYASRKAAATTCKSRTRCITNCPSADKILSLGQLLDLLHFAHPSCAGRPGARTSFYPVSEMHRMPSAKLERNPPGKIL